MKVRHICRVALLMGLGLGFGARSHAAAFGASTPYYEDDGWLDITEWFDGNDYNPTDEAWWRWDDETYQAAKDTSGDRDSDGWYGYSTRDDNDWYYDYYDPYPYTYYDYGDNGLYDYGARYFDYDNDGVYDAYASYSDTDGDGLYDDYDYYSFTDTGNDKQRQQAKTQVSRQSRQQTVTGKVEKTKLVNVRGGKQHVVISIQPQQQQQQLQQQQGKADQASGAVLADLGDAEGLKDINPKLGESITVKGPRAQVGQHAVLLAKSFELNGETKQVDRNPREFTGKVLSTHKAKVRGKEHLMAMVETTQKGKAQKIAVDLGQADRLKASVNKGVNLTFSGFPVKVKNKPLIVAQTIRQDDKVVQINRQQGEPGDKAQPAAGKIQGTQQQQQNQQGEKAKGEKNQ